MASFEVCARTVEIQEHPNADSLEIGQVFGYQSVVGKGQFQTGDVVIYLPEQSLLPDKLIKHVGLTGKLAGSKKNRIKAVRLRQVLSQGICIGFEGLAELYPDKVMPPMTEGSDFQEYLEVEKWKPEIPAKFGGTWVNPEEDDVDLFVGYTDIENIKRFPNVFQEGEEVVATEKAHGTCFMASLINEHFYVSSKGVSHRKCAIIEEEGNVYWKAARQYELEEKMRILLQMYKYSESRILEITIFGEVVGVQDLKYGADSQNPHFYVFDIRIDGSYLDTDMVQRFCHALNLTTVPILYQGTSIAEALKFTDGLTVINGAKHIREGIVIRPAYERFDSELRGRAILKSVSGDYLTRKGEVSEYE